jgi:putative ABC transport system permease protein
VFSLFTVLAMFVACLGLFGLVSYTTSMRTKEIGIRKVVGASIQGIVGLLSGNFIKLVLLANLLAWPLTYWSILKWLENYAFHIEISLGLFLVPTLLVLMITLVTVSVQTLKAARANPINVLRNE